MAAHLKRTDLPFESLRQRRWIQVALYAVVLGINLWILSAAPLKGADRMALDRFFKYRPPIPVDSSIVCIEIAEDGLNQIGRWPWPRKYHAALIHLLHTWGAKAAVFDILFSEPSAPLDDGALEEAMRESGRVYLPAVLETKKEKPLWVHSLPNLERYAKGIGHINAVPDEDGVLRRIQPYLRAGHEEIPHLALKVAYDLLGQKVPRPGNLPFPVDDEGRLLVNWAGRWTQAFRHYSYVDLLRSFEAVRRGSKPLIPPQAIQGKICLIGLTAMGNIDIRAIPLEPLYPGLGLQANVINNVLTRQFIRRASPGANALALLGVGLTTCLFFMLLPPVAACTASGVLALAWITAAFLLFSRHAVWFSIAHPLLCIVSVFVASMLYIQIADEKVRQRLSLLATRDGLTGLYVIRHIRALLNQAVKEARREGTALSVLMIDIDHFKRVNDTGGHAAGDQALKQVSAILQSLLRETDASGRYGGDEIIVILPRTTLEVAVAAGERIRGAMEKSSFNTPQGAVAVTVSGGAATLHPDETVPEPMIKRADEALYQAKQQGRNRVCAESNPSPSA